MAASTGRLYANFFTLNLPREPPDQRRNSPSARRMFGLNHLDEPTMPP
jgi:hypothetical protein